MEIQKKNERKKNAKCNHVLSLSRSSSKWNYGISMTAETEKIRIVVGTQCGQLQKHTRRRTLFSARSSWTDLCDICRFAFFCN